MLGPEVDIWRIVLLWQQYLNAITFGLIAFWWGRVQVMHIIEDGEWGGSIGWLIAGVAVLALGLVMAMIINAIENYCMSIGWAYIPKCMKSAETLRPLKSTVWWVIFAGAVLVLRPTVRGRDWWIVAIMVIAALSIGAFIFGQVGGFDLIYK